MRKNTQSPAEAFDRSQEVLVVGVDASGKSTLLEGLVSLGYSQHECTGTPEVHEFKSINLSTPLDADYIDARQRMFLQLCATSRTELDYRKNMGEWVATTDNSLVTLLSHTVMRQVVSIVSSPSQHKEVVHDWLDNERELPEVVGFTYASLETIRNRILIRQRQGNKSERFWGFNSLLFLGRYQDAWHETLEVIEKESDIRCVDFDTSRLDQRAVLNKFIEHER